MKQLLLVLALALAGVLAGCASTETTVADANCTLTTVDEWGDVRCGAWQFGPNRLQRARFSLRAFDAWGR